MESLSPNTLTKIAEMLSPKDVAMLSSCSPLIRLGLNESDLGRRPLRIQLISQHGQLDHHFFVSEQNGRMLRHDEHLAYERKYCFWVYDEERCQQVNLVRHSSHSEGVEKYFDLALMAKRRTTFDYERRCLWEVGGCSANHHVDWRSPISLRCHRMTGLGTEHPNDEPPTCLRTRPAARPRLPTWFVGTSSSAQPIQGIMLVNSELFTPIAIEMSLPRTALEIRAVQVFYLDEHIKIYSERGKETGLLVPPSRLAGAAVVEFELWTTSTHLFISSSDLSFSLATPLLSAPDDIKENEKYEELVLDAMYNVGNHDIYLHAHRFFIAKCADAQHDVILVVV